MIGRLLKRAADPAISMTDWAKLYRPGAQFVYGGATQQGYSAKASGGGSGYYDTNAVAFAITSNRVLLFSEARFQFQQIRSGKPGDLFGTEALQTLEEPWQGATTRDLLAQAELDVTCFGNSYWVPDREYPGKLMRLDPANVYIITERAIDDVYAYTVGDRVISYAYRHDPYRRDAVVFYDPSEVGHYKPYPSLQNRFLGKSWLSACLPDLDADEAITEHKRLNIRSGATIPYVVSLAKETPPEDFELFVAKFRESHEGIENSGKTLFLGGGADVKTVGQSWEQLSVRAVQGAGETRVAAAAGIPPVIVGLSEGLSAATYSNYSQARRRLVDGTMRPLWGAFASAMESLVEPPENSRLWYDDREIAFLREDIMDQAEIKSRQALTIESLIRGGFEPDTAVDAVTSGDFTRLKHTGLYSVQLQPPGSEQPGPAAPPAGD